MDLHRSIQIGDHVVSRKRIHYGSRYLPVGTQGVVKDHAICFDFIVEFDLKGEKLPIVVDAPEIEVQT